MSPSKKGQRSWTEDELLVLRELFPEHGSRWDGWDDHLPGRTQAAIQCRAHVSGLRMSPGASREHLAAGSTVRERARRDAQQFSAMEDLVIVRAMGYAAGSTGRTPLECARRALFIAANGLPKSRIEGALKDERDSRSEQGECRRAAAAASNKS